MRKFLGAMGAAAVFGFLSASGASASTTVGSECESTGWLIAGIEEFHFSLASAEPGSLTSAPGAGVATRWTAGLRAGSSNGAQLKVVRTVPGSNQVQVIAQSSAVVAVGRESLPIRIPVQAGDRFGLSGGPICDTDNPADLIGSSAANGQPGTTESYSEISGYRPALSVVIEPDIDGDGYGDESQDGCPASVAYTGPCPTIELSTSTSSKQRAILVKVGTTFPASVQVFGQVQWKIRQPGPNGKVRGLIQGLGSGGPRLVPPGEPVSFRVKLEKTVLRRLGRLEPSQKLTANLTARTTDIAGRLVQRHFKVRLPGRG